MCYFSSSGTYLAHENHSSFRLRGSSSFCIYFAPQRRWNTENRSEPIPSPKPIPSPIITETIPYRYKLLDVDKLGHAPFLVTLMSFPFHGTTRSWTTPPIQNHDYSNTEYVLQTYRSHYYRFPLKLTANEGKSREEKHPESNIYAKMFQFSKLV